VFMVLVGVCATTFAFFVLLPLYRQYELGCHLTRLISMVEQVEANKLIGVSIDDMPASSRAYFEAELERRIAFCRKFSPALITRELLKNSLVAKRFGRDLRERSIYQLIEILYFQGAAMHVDDFHRENFLAQHGL